MAPVSEWYIEAQKLHQADRFPEAEALYRRIVDADPDHIGAWHLIGLVCTAQNNVPAAMDGFQRVLALSPDHVEALTKLGILLAREHRLPEAIGKFKRAIELCPEQAQAHNNLGVVLTQMGRRDEGLACYKEAARLAPDYAEAHFNLALALVESNQRAQGIESYRRAIQARPDHAGALGNLGMLLVEERRASEGVIYLEQAARLEPNNASSHNNLCLALADVGRFEDAVASAEAGLRLHPFDPKTHANRGNALASLDRVDEAIGEYDVALLLQPDYASAHWNRSLAWLVQGNYKRGWVEYEWRWKRPETKTRNFPEPRWDGSSLKGKTILLWCEQGLGDTMQFVRYAAEVKKHGGTVWLECPAKMIPLLSTCAGIDRMLPEGSPLPAGFDCQAPLMSMPFLCGTTALGTVPSMTPYLSAHADHVGPWRQDLGHADELKVGIAWQGNPGHKFDQHRSFPLHWFKSLAGLEGVKLYSLQKGHGTEQLTEAKFPVVDLGSRLDEKCGAFQETAAVMESLDLIITCDSGLAHLAGALGRPVWLLLSTPADWRWLRDRDDTPWYPTMRIFRQTKLGQWGPVFERVEDALHKRLTSAATGIHIEVAPGELLDKLTILQIKSERVTDAEKLRNVRAELAVVEATRRQRIRDALGFAELLDELKSINEKLWDIENDIRDCEAAEDFGSKFVGLARAVYKTNDRRAVVKRKLNELLGAKFSEVKQYHGE